MAQFKNLMDTQPVSARYTTITDPAVNAATSTALIDIYGGVIVTTTTTGNAQTLQTPTSTTAGKIFTIVNNDTSTNDITVNGIVLPVGKSVSYVRDGSAWVTIEPVTAINELDTEKAGLSLANVFTQANTFNGVITPYVKASTSAGIEMQCSNGSVCLTLGAGGGLGATFADGVTVTNAFISNNGAGDYDFTIKKNLSGTAYIYDAGLDTHTFSGAMTANTGINVPTGQTYKINSVDINTAGTLTNVAYLNAANAFTNVGINSFTGSVDIGSGGAGKKLTVYQARTTEAAATITETVLNLPDLTSKTGGLRIDIANIGVGDGRIRNIITDSSAHQYSYEVVVNGNTSTFARDGILYLPSGIILPGNINTTAGAFQINGTSINTAGTLSNVAYLNGNNTFTGTLNFVVNNEANRPVFENTGTSGSNMGGVVFKTTSSTYSTLIHLMNSGGTPFVWITGLYGDDAYGIQRESSVLLKIPSSGNVLIGTTTDNTVDKLQVNGSVSGLNILRIRSSNDTGFGFIDFVNLSGVETAFVGFGNETDYKFYIANRKNTDMYIRTNDTDRITIQADGDVGIGTTSPAKKLDVVGDIRYGNSDGGARQADFLYNVLAGSYQPTGANADNGTSGARDTGWYTTGLGTIAGSTSGYILQYDGLNIIAMPDGYGRVGILTSTPKSKLHIYGSYGRKVSTFTDSQNIDLGENIVLCNKSSAMTITLPAASGCTDRVYTIKNINTGVVTIDGNASETIDGATTIQLSTQYASVDIVSNGTNRFII